MQKLSLARKPKDSQSQETKPSTENRNNGFKKNRRVVYVNKKAGQTSQEQQKPHWKDAEQKGKPNHKPHDKKRKPTNKKTFKKAKPTLTPEERYQGYMKQRRTQEAVFYLSRFGERFNFEQPLVLSKGIKQEVIAELKARGDTRSNYALNKEVSFALYLYTTNPRYQAKFIEGEYRYDLNGNQTTQLTNEEIQAIHQEKQEANKVAMIRRKRTQEHMRNLKRKERQKELEYQKALEQMRAQENDN